MSQNFRFRSDEIEENDIGTDERNSSDAQVKTYATDGQIRNISFTLSNGEKQFLNYAYLISVTCSVNDERITLHFTTCKVQLKGLQLKSLYSDLMFQKPLEITPMDSRYNATLDYGKPVVNEIIIIE